MNRWNDIKKTNWGWIWPKYFVCLKLTKGKQAHKDLDYSVVVNIVCGCGVILLWSKSLPSHRFWVLNSDHLAFVARFACWAIYLARVAQSQMCCGGSRFILTSLLVQLESGSEPRNQQLLVALFKNDRVCSHKYLMTEFPQNKVWSNNLTFLKKISFPNLIT